MTTTEAEQKTRKKSSGQKRKNPKVTLTAEELSLQKVRGKYYRDLLRQATEDLIADVDTSKVGIMLSGGVDSTTTLWQLLELGVRPYVYTIGFPNKVGLSVDASRAKHLAEVYKLPFKIVTMTSSANKLAEEIKDISYEHIGLHSRADHEVVVMFRETFRVAAEDGMDIIFSGISDENIHLVGRKQEVRARSVGMPVSECNYRRLYSFGSEQHLVIADEATRAGINLGLPQLPVASMNPYLDVPWHVTNSPRLKAITIDAWSVEEETSGIRAFVSPMQCSDSGAREYFDQSIKSSTFVSELIGRPASSAIVYYNWLKKNRYDDGTGGKDSAASGLEWFSHVTAGEPLPEGYITLVEPNGDAKAPDKYGIDLDEENSEDEDEDLFADVFEDDLESDDVPDSPLYTRLEDGSFDKRIDCLGNPFWGQHALKDCARAQAGLCNKFQAEENPYRVQDCIIWGDMTEWNSHYMNRMADNSGSAVAGVYRKWAEKALENAQKIADGSLTLPS